MSSLEERFLPARLGPDFRWLLASSWISNAGDGVLLAAGPLLVASLTDDAFVVALAAALNWLAPLAFSLGAGALADRADRRRIVMVCNALRCGVLVALTTMLVTDSASVGAVLLCLFLVGVAETFADVSAISLLPDLVAPVDLPVASARLQTGFLVLNQFAGAPVGAALFALGRGWPFATHAVLLLAGIVTIARVRSQLARHGDPEAGEGSTQGGGGATERPGRPARGVERHLASRRPAHAQPDDPDLQPHLRRRLVRAGALCRSSTRAR